MVIFILMFTSALAGVKVKVVEPPDLKNSLPNNGVLTSTLANFGNPPYGSYILGRVHKYPGKVKGGCSALDPVKFEDETNTYSHPILLLDRGNCSFVVKARHAQSIGAQALIIIDNSDENVNKIVMVDDGTAGNIFIPTMMISKADGEVIKNFISAHHNKHVRMQLSFDVPNPDNRVEYEFWMSPENHELQVFLADFAKHAKALKDKTFFVPHFGIWYSVERQREGFKTKHKDCLGAGRYCAFDPDYNGDKNGGDIMREVLRQICIFSEIHHQDAHNNPNLKTIWWDYVSQYHKCDLLDEDCSKRIIKSIGIKQTEVDQCFQASVDGKNIEMDPNYLLENERKLMKERGAWFFPTIFINGVPYRGDLEADEVLKMICAGFKKQPQYCVEYFDQKEGKKSEEGISAGTVLLIMFFALVAFLVILFFYRKWLRRDMNYRMKAEVSAAVNQYIALTDQSLNRD
jgi:hypothetical protein